MKKLALVFVVALSLAGCKFGGGGGGGVSLADSLPPIVQLPPASEPQPACWDGIDNDGDGLTDYGADPGCDLPTDTDETDAPIPPVACGDGLAAIDLSGTCRRDPPTPGALEAVQ
jgi:hypothetical protein